MRDKPDAEAVVQDLRADADVDAYAGVGADVGRSAGRDTDGTPGRKRIDLNVPQAAAGAVAAVVAAKLASYFGVYGTILGAGVVSVLVTCGTSVIQHFFRRTGEQLREARSQATGGAGDEARAGTGAAEPESAAAGPPAPGDFSPATVYRSTTRRWKRPVLAAALVFVVTMGGITTYELAAGNSLSGFGGTTVGRVFSGDGGSSQDRGPGADDETPAPARTGDGSGVSPDGTAGTDDGDTGTAPSPSATPGTGTADGQGSGTSTNGTGPGTDSGSGDTSTGDQGTGTGTVTGEPTAPATDGAPPTSPAPGADSRSGTGVPDQGGPATR